MTTPSEREVNELLDKYPNIGAIYQGSISGNFREWPLVRVEMKGFVVAIASALASRDAEVARLTEENARLKEALEWIRVHDGPEDDPGAKAYAALSGKEKKG